MIALSAVGRVGCLVLSIAIGVMATGTRTILALAAVTICAALTHPRALRSVLNVRVASLLAVLLIPAAFLGGERDMAVMGLGISRTGVILGAQMVVRALTILIAIAAFAASLSVAELSGLFERAGMRGLGFAMGVAINMLPSVTRTASTVYHALRLRGGFVRRRFRGLGLLLVTTIVSSLRQAEDVVAAAEARGFAVDRARLRPLAWRPADVALMAALLLVGLVLALW